MYGKIYFSIYRFFKSKNNQDPTFNSACLVFISQVLHFFTLALLISNIFNLTLPVFSEDNTVNKWFFFPIAIIWLFIIHKFFEKRIEDLNKKFQNEKEYNFYLLITVVVIIPLFAVIKLSGGSLWK